MSGAQPRPPQPARPASKPSNQASNQRLNSATQRRMSQAKQDPKAPRNLLPPSSGTAKATNNIPNRIPKPAAGASKKIAMMPSLRRKQEMEAKHKKQCQFIRRGFPKGVLLDIILFCCNERFKVALKLLRTEGCVKSILKGLLKGA